jgi:hypothetical protein
MKNQPLILSAILATAVLASCGKEELANKQTDAALDYRSSTIAVSAWWAYGATDLESAAATPRQTNTISVINNYMGTGRIGFQRWSQSGSNNFGRTLSSTNNGVVSHAFADSGKNWKAMVPFAFGTHTASGNEAIWTPGFANVNPRPVNMGLFVTDNSSSDEDATADIIEIGDFRALDLTVNGNPRIAIEQKVGANWVRVARSDGNTGRADLVSFAVVSVRTDYSVTAGKVSAPTLTLVPVLKALNTTTNKTELWTIPHVPVMNVGARKMYIFP